MRAECARIRCPGASLALHADRVILGRLGRCGRNALSRKRSSREPACGVVTITVAGRSGARTNQISYCCNGILPLRRRFGSEGPQRGPGDEVALKVECVVDGGMHAQKALGRTRRLEPLHFMLSSSHDLVGDAMGRAARTGILVAGNNRRSALCRCQTT
jgi:hypothetical protein